MKSKKTIACIIGAVFLLLFSFTPVAIAQSSEASIQKANKERPENITLGITIPFSLRDSAAHQEAHLIQLLRQCRITPSLENSESTLVSEARASGILQGSYRSLKWILVLNTGVLTISGSGEVVNIWRDSNGNEYSKYIKKVTIGNGLNSLANGAFANCENLTSITLPNTLTQVGANAFYGCKNLTQISLPTNVTTIGEYAFATCEKLKKVTLPQKLVTIGSYAFGLCSNLETVTFPSKLTNIEEGAFFGCASLKSSAFPAQLSSIGNYAFWGCTALTEANIPCAVGEQAFQECTNLSSVSVNGNIGLGAFQSCTALKDVTLGQQVKKMAAGAFNMCSALENISIPSDVLVLEERVFGGCDALKSVEFQGNCVEFGIYAFVNALSLEHIVLPNTLKKIDEYCFAGSSLRSITMPKEVNYLGNYAFALCKQLESINIPDCLTELGEGCFFECDNLKVVDFPDRFVSDLNSIKQYTFYKCTHLKEINIPENIESIESAAFAYCYDLKKIHLPQSLVTIADGVMGCCESLESVVIPEHCTSIGAQSFYGCKKLRSITLPSSITSMGSSLFYDCASLEQLDIPQGVNIIEHHLLYGCTSLERVSLPSAATEIQDCAFMNCTKISRIDLPKSITRLGDAAFSNTAITKLTLPESLKSLGEESFAMCKELRSITLPSSITTIPRGCFVFCFNLETVVLSPNTTAISDYAFADCGKLRTINLPGSINTIGDSSFANCVSLSALNFTDSLNSIGKEAFANCSALRSIYLGKRLSQLGDYALAGCTGLEQIDVSSANTHFSSQNGILFSDDYTILLYYPPLNSQQIFEMPDNLTTLAPGALYQCKNIKSIVFSSSITRIEARTFYECTGLTSITIPANIIYIGDYAFSQCSNLQSIRLHDGIESFGEGVFSYCSSLKSLDLPANLTTIPPWFTGMCSSLQQVQIPESVTTIGESAFFACESLEQLILPQGLTEIGNMAFADCDALTMLSFPPSIELIPGGVCKYCDSLAEVHFEGGVYYIGEDAFSNNIALQKVHFAGNAPTSFGKNAFVNTGSSMTLYYVSSADGFSVPEWTGPDHVNYHTATVYTGSCGKTATYTLDSQSGVMTILGNGDMYNYATNEERPWHDYSHLIQHVVVSEGITSIGSLNFADCSNLLAVDLPASLTSTNYAGFVNCYLLSEFNAEGGLTSVAPCLFYNCYHLEDIILSKSCTEIGQYAFYNCRTLNRIVLPEAMKKIREGAFAYCIDMQEVTFEGSIDSIDSGAFLGCDALATIYMEADMPKSISEYAFSGIEANLTIYAGDEAFSWKGSDGSTYSTSVIDIASGICGDNIQWRILPTQRTLVIEGNGAMTIYAEDEAPWSSYSGIIQRVEVQSGITYVSDFAFAKLYELTSVSLPDTLLSIGDYAFANCISIEEIEIPQSVTSIGEGVFSTCSALLCAELPSTLDTIPDYCFYGCIMLKDLALPSSITKVGYSSFTGCGMLTAINLPDSVIEIGDYAFASCISLTSLRLPTSLQKIGSSAFLNCITLANINWNNSLHSIGSYAFADTALKQVHLPLSVSLVDEHAFFLCESLSTVDLGSVRTIGAYAFSNTAISTITLPSSVQQVGSNAFSACPNLQALYSQSALYPCEDGVLYYGNMLLQYPAGKTNDRYVLPEHISSVDVSAFCANPYLKHVELGDQVDTLGEATFIFCEALTSVDLGKGITLLPSAIFGECPSLKEVHFHANAPSLIGQDAFLSVPEGLMLYYDTNRKGWTEGEWLGPDNNTYLTTAVEVSELYVTANKAQLNPQGKARAILQITASGSSSIEILSVTVSDERFAAEFDSDARIVTPGTAYTNCSIVPIAPLDATQMYQVEITVSWNSGNATCIVEFMPDTALLYTLRVEDPYDIDPSDTYVGFLGDDIMVYVTASSSATSRECIVLLCVSNRDQLKYSGAAVYTIEPSVQYTFAFEMANCNIDSNCIYQVYLLDAVTFAPLTDQAQCRAFQTFTASGDAPPIRIANVYSAGVRGSMPLTAYNHLADDAVPETTVIPSPKLHTLEHTSRVFKGTPKNFLSDKYTLTLFKTADGELKVEMSLAEKYVTLDGAYSFDHIWEKISDSEYTHKSEAKLSIGGFYTWEKPTSNRHKGPRNGLHIGLDGYFFDRRPTSEKTKTFNNGWSLRGTPYAKIGAGSADVYIQAKVHRKDKFSGGGDIVQAGYEFSLSNAQGESIIKGNIAGSIGSLKKGYYHIPDAKKKYRWKSAGKGGAGWAGFEYSIEIDGEALINLLKDWAKDYLPSDRNEVEHHECEILYCDETDTYSMGTFYFFTGDNSLKVIPVSDFVLNEALIDDSLPTIATKALPSLKDLNLQFTSGGGITAIPPIKPTNTSTEQIQLRSALDILSSGSAAEKAALARVMYMVSGGGAPLPQDAATIVGFMTSGLYNNFTDMYNGIKTGDHISHQRIFQEILGDDIGYGGITLKGHVEIFDQR